MDDFTATLSDGRPLATSGGGVSLRLFLALRVGDRARSLIHEAAQEIVGDHDGVRLVDPDQLHVTVAFLGDVVEEHVPSIAGAQERAAASVPGPVACRIVSGGGYGGGRVLGMDVDLDLLPVIDAARDRFLDAVQPFAPDADQRSWRPHVSIARAARGSVLPGSLLANPSPIPLVGWIAPELQLLASLPAPGGRQHRVLHAVPFGTVVATR